MNACYQSTFWHMHVQVLDLPVMHRKAYPSHASCLLTYVFASA